MKKGDSNADVSESSKKSAEQSSENADSEKENASENIQSPTAGIKVNIFCFKPSYLKLTGPKRLVIDVLIFILFYMSNEPVNTFYPSTDFLPEKRSDKEKTKLR